MIMRYIILSLNTGQPRLTTDIRETIRYRHVLVLAYPNKSACRQDNSLQHSITSASQSAFTLLNSVCLTLKHRKPILQSLV